MCRRAAGADRRCAKAGPVETFVADGIAVRAQKHIGERFEPFGRGSARAICVHAFLSFHISRVLHWIGEPCAALKVYELELLYDDADLL
jgi:hypothetical protein